MKTSGNSGSKSYHVYQVLRHASMLGRNMNNLAADRDTFGFNQARSG